MGIRSSVLEDAPLWLKKYTSLICEYILYEYQDLPSELVKLLPPSQTYTEETAEVFYIYYINRLKQKV